MTKILFFRIYLPLLLAMLLTTSCKLLQPTVNAEDPKPVTFSAQLTKAFEPPPEVFEIDPIEDAKINTRNGTGYFFSKGTFQGSKKVRLEIRETLSPLESYALHLPMRSETGEVFESDGMFRIDTEAQPNRSAAIRIKMKAISTSPMNVYAWIDGRWKYQGKNQYQPASDERPDSEEFAERSFTGVAVNTWYNFDLPIPRPDLGCVAVKVPMVTEFLELTAFATDGRSVIESRGQNTAIIGVSFRKATKMNLLLLGPGNKYWVKRNVLMPQHAGESERPDTCQTLDAQWKDMPPSNKLRLGTHPLVALARKYGRIARIETKSREDFTGYFNQQGANMTIQTVQGEVVIPVSSVEKVTPLDLSNLMSRSFFEDIDI